MTNSHFTLAGAYAAEKGGYIINFFTPGEPAIALFIRDEAELPAVKQKLLLACERANASAADFEEDWAKLLKQMGRPVAKTLVSVGT